MVWTGDQISSMRRFTDEVNKVAKGIEFGIAVPFADTRQGDRIVAYTMKTVKKSLELSVA